MYKLSTVKKMIKSREYDFAKGFLISVSGYMEANGECTPKQDAAIRNIRKAAKKYKEQGPHGISSSSAEEIMERGWDIGGDPHDHGNHD